jgi:hypothetical protein
MDNSRGMPHSNPHHHSSTVNTIRSTKMSGVLSNATLQPTPPQFHGQHDSFYQNGWSDSATSSIERIFNIPKNKTPVVNPLKTQ